MLNYWCMENTLLKMNKLCNVLKTTPKKREMNLLLYYAQTRYNNIITFWYFNYPITTACAWNWSILHTFKDHFVSGYEMWAVQNSKNGFAMSLADVRTNLYFKVIPIIIYNLISSKCRINSREMTCAYIFAKNMFEMHWSDFIWCIWIIFFCKI